jgi:23S rRNA pseudouridine2605 synthase
MRLNRFIASSGVTSRRKADALIDQGKVTINGRIVTELGVQVRTYADQVAVEGKIISVRERHLYLLLNKPKDTISTVKDEIGRSTVLDYVNTHERLYPVGRLDRNTTGVLLLTNDGDLTQRLTHPRYEIEREYHATLDKPLAFKDAEALAKGGVSIGGGNITPALYLSISKLDARDVVVVIKEGKYREVRRMFEKFGYEVKKLDRTMFAGITHTGMKRGDVRPLIPKEIRTLKRLAGLASEDDSFFEKRSSARPRVRTERSKPTPLAKKIAPKSKSAPPRKTASRSPVLAKKKK